MKWRTRDFWRQRDGLWMIRNKHSEWNSSATRPDASCAEAETDKGGNCDHRLIISAGQETANINFMNLVFQKYNDDVHSRHHCRMATKTKTDFDSGGINVDMYEWLNTQTERRTGCILLWMGGWRHDALLVWMKELFYHEVRPQPSPTTTTVSLQQPAAFLSDLHSELTRIIKT